MLEKQKIVDRIETLENGCIQVRTVTRVLDEAQVIAQSFHRHVIHPGDDYSNEDPKVQAICALIHTPQTIENYLLQRNPE